MSEDVQLARITPSDVDVFFAITSNPEVARFLFDGHPPERAQAKALIEASERLYQSIGLGLWSIKGPAGPLGFVGFHIFDVIGPEPQLVYALLPEAQGYGYATDAAGQVIRRARAKGLSHVWAAVDAPNEASHRVLDRLGFVFWESRMLPVGPTDISLLGHRETLTIDKLWDGTALPSDEHARLALHFDLGGLSVEVDAPFYGDPAPELPPGVHDGLWNYEVVELFIAGPGGGYIELEMGPHGHQLGLRFQKVREEHPATVDFSFRAQRGASRWTGHAWVGSTLLPARRSRVNAYAISGPLATRRYRACFPVPGESPDFHRLECFGRLGGSKRDPVASPLVQKN